MDAKALFLLIMIGGIVGVVIFLRRGGGRSGPGPIELGRPLMERFFQMTGYAFPDARQAPVPMQVERWVQVERAYFTGSGYNIHLVRNYQGLDVNFQSSTNFEARTRSHSQIWWTAPAPLSAPFHVVDRAMAQGPNRGSLPDNWQPAFPNAVLTGDPQFDQRFIVFSPASPQRIQAIFQNPRLRGALLACRYVDLRVLSERVVFSDPMQGNTIDAMGGPGAAASLLSKPGKIYEHGIPVHDRVADILLGATSLAR